MARKLTISRYILIFATITFLRIGYFNRTQHIYHVKDDLKYILLWTKPNTIPFKFLGRGQETFLRRKCRIQNCFVTADASYFRDITDFDAVLFHGPEILGKNIEIPNRRSYKQKYVFVSIESPHNYPDCSATFNNFFNWTWTYKLDSDVPFKYLTVRDKSGKVIGPAKNISWVKEMAPIKEEVRKKLRHKSKAVAWFLSNCNSLSNREAKALDLQSHLDLYGLTLDTYGDCGEYQCKRGHEECWKTIENDYYFYLSFENSFATDYVTDKLLNALLHYAVPVVLGSADYKRFMPDGIYLDIQKLGGKEVARLINKAIKNPDEYYEYFRWHNHYTYEATSREGEAPDSDNYCKLCEMLNDPVQMGRMTICQRFEQWWNMRHVCNKYYFVPDDSFTNYDE